MQRGAYAEACPKLEASLELDYGIGTEFNLADCREHLGDLVRARDGFLRVAAAATATSQRDRARLARGRADALTPRIAEAERAAKPLVAAATTASPNEEAPAEPAPEPRGERPSASFPAPVVDRGSGQRTAGLVVGGVGVVGLGVAAGFGLASLSKRADARAACDGDICTEAGVRHRDEAIEAGTWSTVAAVVGGVTLATGIVIFATAKEAPSERRAAPSAARPWTPTKLEAVPHVAMNGGGIGLRGVLP